MPNNPGRWKRGHARPNIDLKKPSSINVFCAYSHANERERRRLEKHLSQLKNDNLISTWHDRKIGAGKEWQKEIDKYLESSEIILLLISHDFLSSDYCYGVEMKRAMEATLRVKLLSSRSF